ncbi:HAMP domain-containing protein [Streptomyces sp. AJS327]|uniref:sensor histidine kinase n=1 Tax=Streptomyces sp. AJS327 TaxID=2545265 RepID=UPI0015DE90F8|nr:nitrate- and nitrite sensing domain-containing protein [Streptomyces sp. AJS327]MBA0051557.1 HAMP domain-containing protein [Streptomyces sp. AJS327]
MRKKQRQSPGVSQTTTPATPSSTSPARTTPVEDTSHPEGADGAPDPATPRASRRSTGGGPSGDGPTEDPGTARGPEPPAPRAAPDSDTNSDTETDGPADTVADAAAAIEPGGGAEPEPMAATAPDTAAPPEPATGPAVPTSRRARVRNRLLVSVVLCAAAVLAAGAPAVLDATRNLAESQELVRDAELTQRASTLSHSLADERDAMVEFIAGGRISGRASGATESQRSRVDRQAEEIREGAPESVRRVLRTVPKLRQRALSGTGGALDTYQEYTRAVEVLHRLTDRAARKLPSRAGDVTEAPVDATTARALPDLARAVDGAAASRGLLRGALAGPGSQSPLMERAQRERVREQAAIADFEGVAGRAAREAYRSTVNGTDVSLAERYLRRLTDRPALDAGDRGLSAERVDTTLLARVDRMRGVQSSFATAEVRRLEGLRDADVTTLELRLALVGGALLIAVGVSVHTARSVARPLSVLRRGSGRLAADPAGAEPVRFKGRNDEFADVVRALNSLAESATSSRERALESEADRARLEGGRIRLEATRDELTGEQRRLRDELDTVRTELATARGELASAQEEAEAARAEPSRAEAERERAETIARLALRALGLVERQLGVIEGLEEKETDPDRLGTLFALDHLATRMRRHGENLLLLSGAERTAPRHPSPAPLLDVMRAAVSEIEHYKRVALGSLPPRTKIAGPAAGDLGHLLAELLDNATAASPPETQVRLAADALPSGEVLVSVRDDGVGLPPERMDALNALLEQAAANGAAAPERDGARVPAGLEALPVGEFAGPGTPGLGLRVVALLATRRGFRVELRERPEGGTAASVVVPEALVLREPTPGTEPLPEPGTRAPSSFDITRPPRPLTAAEVQDAHDAQEAAEFGGISREHSAEPEPTGGQGREHERREGPEGPAPVRSAPPAVTGKGLPKRTPKHRAPQRARPERPVRGTTDAEELRRRLGGFQRGAREGLREAEARLAAELPGEHDEPDGTGPTTPSGRRNPGAAPGPQGDPARQPDAAPGSGRAAEPGRDGTGRSGAQSDGGTAEEARR